MLFVVAASCVGGVDSSQPEPGLPVSEYRPAPALEPIGDAALAELDAAIDAIFAAPPLSATSDSATIIDAETGQVVYQRDPDLLLKPASNTKLLTTAVAMDELGSDHRMTTGLYSDATIDGGVLLGDLHIVGEHDFTWSSRLFGDPRIPVVETGRALRAAGVDRVSGVVYLHGEYLFEGDNFAYYDAAAHRQEVAGEVTSAFAAAGVELGAVQLAAGFATPAGAELLASWKSPPLEVAAAPLNKVSHNEFADILARHVGYLLGGESSYGAWNAELLGWLGAAGIDTTGIQFHDGSGLSHDNRVSSRALVQTLDYMLDQPAGAAWERTFAIGNRDGTLGRRLGGSD
ncbi:MAG: D-alanyl-D-alanine carboxypeptidase, partial [Deltaproteobacteria bacterium]|nr:D-alanyl-D-alanine carboxypeptidase [Deltaproteobacteria bacterium]